MNSVNRIGLIAAGSIFTVFLIGYGIYVGLHALFPAPIPTPTPSSNPSQVLNTSKSATIDTDTDGDSLPDLIESSYLADPTKPDTDGDGTTDGDEIALERDPTKAGPDDPLPSASELAKKQQTLSFTDRYLATLPSNADQAQVLNKQRIEAFIVDEQKQLLPDIPASSLKTTSKSGKEAVQAYLDGISSQHNTAIKPVTSDEIEEAFRLYYSNNSPESLQTLIQTLEQNVRLLKTVETPAETLELHKKLIAASQALVDNTKLLQNMSKDFVGGLMGAKNIEDLGPIFQDIGKQVQAFEVKYNLK